MEQAAPAFKDSLELEEALKLFFSDNLVQDSDGGYSANWAKLKLGPLTLAFPNSAARVRALRRHDLHHIAAGYDTSFVGEAEIGAWEIAGGCGGHWLARPVPVVAMDHGIFLAPYACLCAFARGRRTRNLYRTAYSEALAQATVGGLRDYLGLQKAPAQPRVSDALLFGFWSAAGVAILLSMIGLTLSPIAILVWLML